MILVKVSTHSTKGRMLVGDSGICMTCFYFLTLGHLWGAVGTAGGALNNGHPLLCSSRETSMKAVYTYEIHVFVKRWRTIASSTGASLGSHLASAAS